MSRIFLKHYNSFNREILAEFLSAKQLTELDKNYNKAKLKRLTDRILKEIS